MGGMWGVMCAYGFRLRHGYDPSEQEFRKGTGVETHGHDVPLGSLSTTPCYLEKSTRGIKTYST